MTYEPVLSDAYLQYLAKCVTDDAAMHDDLVQEGRIKVWQMLEKDSDHPRQYFVVAVKRRMACLMMGRERPTGYDGRRGYVDVMSPKHRAPEPLEVPTQNAEGGVDMEIRQILTETPFDLLDRMPAVLVGLVA